MFLYRFEIYKIEPLLHFTNKVLFAPASYAKMFGSDECLIQFFLYLYPILLFPLTTLNIMYNLVDLLNQNLCRYARCINTKKY